MSMLSNVAPWDLVAEGYADVTMGLFQAYSAAALDHIPVGPGDHIADIACGPGTLALLAADRGATVAASDFSGAMLAELDNAIAARGAQGVSALQGDGQDLPYADGSFDAAFSMFGLMFFPDRAKGYAEMLRVLKPGATACVSSWAPVAASPLLLVMAQAMQQVHPALPAPTYDIESLENRDVLEAEMTAAGFRDVTIYEVEHQAPFPSATALWDGLVTGSAPVAVMRAAMDDAHWQAASERAIAFLEAEAGPFPATLGATAYLGIGRKPPMALL